jgi:LPXTG-site transpeptidase (sortase) family protein
MRRMKAPATTLKRLNDGLTLVVLALAMYILLAPLYPQAIYWWHQHFDKGSVAESTVKKHAGRQLDPKLEELIVPAALLHETIHEGPDQSVLHQGVWRLPFTSTPDKGGNTVIIGHRFYYTSAAVFYNLDKVKAGQKIYIYWKGKDYAYLVHAIKVVPPSDVSVQAASKQPMLTLYTCTPLWTSKFRLVIQATLVGVTS